MVHSSTAKKGLQVPSHASPGCPPLTIACHGLTPTCRGRYRRNQRTCRSTAWSLAAAPVIEEAGVALKASASSASSDSRAAAAFSRRLGAE